MRTAREWLCDTPDNPGCMRVAVANRLCHAEGCDISLCVSCNEEWISKARNVPELAVRCPRCAPKYLAHLGVGSAPGAGPAVPARVTPRNEQVGPLYAAVDQAMFAQGVLVDVRRRVLDMLSSQEDFRLRNEAVVTPQDDEVHELAVA